MSPSGFGESYFGSGDASGVSREELLEIVAECALEGRAPTDELRAAASAAGIDLDRELEAFERTAALLATSIPGTTTNEPIPTALDARLHRLGEAWFDPPQPAGRIAPSLPLAIAAGVAIGAAATIAIMSTVRASERFAIEPRAFLATHPSAVHWAWQATDDPHVTGQLRGEAYFDPESEDGVLEIEGLAVNDASRERYQLWIFDAERDERYPVDGGVFDITHEGRTLVPVRARLPVGQPVMFAVTIERPGGAVVSDRRVAMFARP